VSPVRWNPDATNRTQPTRDAALVDLARSHSGQHTTIGQQRVTPDTAPLLQERPPGSDLNGDRQFQTGERYVTASETLRLVRADDQPTDGNLVK